MSAIVCASGVSPTFGIGQIPVGGGDGDTDIGANCKTQICIKPKVHLSMTVLG